MTARFFFVLLGLALVAGCSNQPPVKQEPTSFWPPAPDEPRIQFLMKYEKSTDVEPPKSKIDEIIMGSEPQQYLPISKPYGLKMWQGKIYICDTKQKGVIVLDLVKHVTRILGVTGTSRLMTPSDIAIGPEGNKYVADVARGAVVIFNNQDQQASSFAHPDFKPIAVAVWRDELAVSDFKLQRVEILDRATGQLRRTIGGAGMNDGQFIMPVGLAYDNDGNLTVCDFMKCRIQKFDREGKLIKAFGAAGVRFGNFVRPKHITIDPDGFLYVVDASFQNVQVFDGNGRLLTFFGSAGSHPGSMYLPVGICYTEDPANMALFQKYIHPAFDAKRLLLVTNQFGPGKVSVYALGQLKPGKTVKDIAQGSTAVPTGIQLGPGTPPPTTLPALPTDEIPAGAAPATGPSTSPAGTNR